MVAEHLLKVRITASRRALGTTKRPIKLSGLLSTKFGNLQASCAPGAPVLRLKQQKRDADIQFILLLNLRITGAVPPLFYASSWPDA